MKNETERKKEHIKIYHIGDCDFGQVQNIYEILFATSVRNQKEEP